MSEYDENMQNYRSESTVSFDGKTCPNCGATVTFDPALGEMSCEYCGYHCKLPEADSENEICELDFESAVNKESFEWGAEKKTVECKRVNRGGKAAPGEAATPARSNGRDRSNRVV